MTKWDLSSQNEWKNDEFPKGAVIPNSGNSDEYVTGGWRSNRPWRDEAKCSQCLICWIYCPDTSVVLEDGKVAAFDLAHCKGCGVCANECPTKAITMVAEGCELPEVK